MYLFDILVNSPTTTQTVHMKGTDGYIEFTLRRRVEIDNKVILQVNQLPNTLGTYTPSSDGYLIPDDFTQENKDKVGKLIAIFKGNNVFD